MFEAGSVVRFVNAYFGEFKAPKHANALYTLGAVLVLALLLQASSGLALAVHYVPIASTAFWNVNRIMRRFRFGWLVKAAHANGASLMFAALYAHVFRGVYYRAYAPPRRAVWLVGSAMFLAVCAVGFLGGVLSWGQVSYWAAVVAAGFVEAVPVVGKLLKLVVMGGYAVGGATLRRFFVFHCVLPFVVIAMACLHVVLVHRRGQLSPIANRLPTRMAFSNVWPALASKDALAVALYLLALAGLCLLAPDLLANSANYAPADYLVTPKNVKPEWYFWPFFAVLKAFESKLAGFVVALALNASLFVLPYAHADLRGVASVRVYRRAAVTFAASFGALAVLGGRQPSSLSSFMSKVCVAWYVGFVAWPLMTRCVRRLVIELEAGALT